MFAHACLKQVSNPLTKISPEADLKVLKKLTDHGTGLNHRVLTFLVSSIKESESAQQGSHSDMDPKLFKTSLCSFYLQGTCKMGDACHYAHGTTQLR